MKKIGLFILVIMLMMSTTIFAGEPLKRNIEGRVEHEATVELKGVSSDVQGVSIPSQSIPTGGGNFEFVDLKTGESSDVPLDGEVYKLTITSPNRYKLEQEITLKPVDPRVPFNNFEESNSNVKFLTDSANAIVNGDSIELKGKTATVTGEFKHDTLIIIEPN